MNREVLAFVIGFGAGTAGWLAVGMLRLTGDPPLIAAVVLGAAVAIAVRHAAGLPGLLLGMLASYPIALSLRVYLFLSDEWAVVMVVFLALAAVGFVGALLVARIARTQKVRST